MGMYDTLIYDCPECGEEAKKQTKCINYALDRIYLEDGTVECSWSFEEGDDTKKESWEEWGLNKLFDLVRALNERVDGFHYGFECDNCGNKFHLEVDTSSIEEQVRRIFEENKFDYNVVEDNEEDG